MTLLSGWLPPLPPAVIPRTPLIILTFLSILLNMAHLPLRRGILLRPTQFRRNRLDGNVQDPVFLSPLPLIQHLTRWGEKPSF